MDNLKSRGQKRLEVISACLFLVFLLNAIYEYFFLGNLSRTLMSMGLALTLAVAPQVNVALMWRGRNDPILESMKSQRGTLIPLKAVPLLFAAIAMYVVAIYVGIS